MLTPGRCTLQFYVTDLNVAEPQEVLRVLDALQTDVALPV